MKKIFKRVSAAVMALAVAATAVVFDVPENWVAAAVGSRYDYQLDDRMGILTINSDTGMTDWKENGFMEADSVQTVEMDSSVTSIPEGAFGFCSNLTSVEIGSGVQTIDANAFYNCRSLTEITVAAGNSKYSSADGVLFNTDKTQLICYPEGKQGSSYEIPSTVTSIEQSAFENCQQLTSVTAAVGSRLTTIESDAFNNCTALTSIQIPASVTFLGTHAFNSCRALQNITIPAGLTSMSINESSGTPFINCANLTAINVEAGNTAYSSVDGVLFNKDKTKLICCPEGTADGYEIPNTVTSVETWAFYACKKLVSMTIPNTVTSIGDKAFSFCTALTSVTIPDTVTSIGDEMFSNCYKLASVTIPNSVTSIGNKAFYNCYNDQFTSVTIPRSVNSIGDEAFSGCSNLTTVTFKSTTPPTIGNKIFYQYNNKLEKIMVPARSVDTYKAVSNLEPYKDKIVEGEADNPCGDNATWEYDETTKTLTISGTGAMTNWTSSRDVPWNDKAADIQKVVIEEGITSIGTYAFKGCSSLTSVTIPNGVDSIGSWAFDGCTELTSITIPSSVTSIKTYAFQNCSQLTSISIQSGSQLKDIGTSAFRDCSCLTAINIPDSVTSIGQYAFSGCTSLMSIRIPNGVTSISANTFNDCTSLMSITIPNSVTYIGANAFYGCSSLTAITIPNNVTSIGQQAFSGCTSLTSITIPEKVVTIDPSAFSNCTGLSSITIPNSVNNIYANAFSGCTNLKTVTFERATLPDTIGVKLFDNCDKLEKIFVPAGSAETYKGSEKLAPYKDKIFEVAAENSCGTNATWAYDEATKTLTISGTGDMYWTGDDAPWTDKKATIEKVVIEDGITSIFSYAFNGCTSLTDVDISDSVKTIGLNAFKGCTGLTNVTIPEGVTTIYSSTFEGCTSLESVTIPDTVTNIHLQAFKNTGLTQVTIPDSVNVIDRNAFDGCTKLETVTFKGENPPNVYDAFSGCTALDKIVVPEGKVDAYKTALVGLAGLPDKVTDSTTDNKCGDNATWALDETTKTLTISGTGGMDSWLDDKAPWVKNPSNIINIQKVVIEDGITSVGVGAFRSCIYLTSVNIPSSVTLIKAEAFASCRNMEIMYPSGAEVSHSAIPETATKVEYTVNNNGKLNVTKITLGTDKDSFTVTNAMNISSVAEDYREYVSQEGHTHNYSDDICQICDYEKPYNACGDNATWEYDETTKTLTISGTGDMTDWTLLGSDVPWADKAADIEKVVINSGITSIGDLAFRGCTGLTSVTIPDGVTSIGVLAFEGCSGLTSVNIPNTVTSIGDGAFSGSGLTSVKIPDGVTSIGDAAFSDSGLTSVTIPESVTSIGDAAFRNCTSLTSITIPKNVNSIGGEAFNGCTNLEKVTFKGATPPATMGNEVFKDCSSDLTITVPEGKADDYKNADGFEDLSEKITADKDNSGSDDDSSDSSGDSSDNSGDSSDNSGDSDNSGSSDDNTHEPDNSGSDDNNNHEPDNSGSNDDNNSNSGNSTTNENTSKDVQLGENVPKTEFATPTEELISAVLTPEELAQLKDTDKVSVVLEIVENVPAEDKQSVGSYLESGSHVLAQYMDVALYKVINDSKTRITSTNKPIRITFEVPEGLRAAGRTFGVLRVHDGETVLLPDLDNDENTVTIETDKFSTYALVYRDNASAPGSDNPPTGIAISLMPFTAALAVVVIAIKRKK